MVQATHSECMQEALVLDDDGDCGETDDITAEGDEVLFDNNIIVEEDEQEQENKVEGIEDIDKEKELIGDDLCGLDEESSQMQMMGLPLGFGSVYSNCSNSKVTNRRSGRRNENKKEKRKKKEICHQHTDEHGRSSADVFYALWLSSANHLNLGVYVISAVYVFLTEMLCRDFCL